MFKNYTQKSGMPPGYIHKILLIMRLTTIILLAAIMQVSAYTFAQQVNLSEKNASLKEVFKDLRKQTNYDFICTEELFQAARTVDITVHKQALKDVLDEIFKHQPLTYTIEDKTIVIKQKEPSLLDNIKSALAIPITVSGKVTDTTGSPLVGATIINKTGGKAILTNDKGQFTLTAQNGDQITISFIGYQPYTFTVKENMPFLQIVLHQSYSKLNEVAVVSTGYQTLPKERATGSFAQPIKAEFDDRVAPDVLSKLNGITSGLVFNANTTLSKSGQLDINIRGRSTIFANDQPLIVVDNFPYSGNINNINPNDVENVTVLKDAAAASIWGVRAGNGVIVITKKKGKLNQPLRVSFNANLTVFNKPDLNYNPNQLDASSYIGLEQYLFGKGYYNSNLTNTTTGPVISPAVQLLAANRAGTLSNTDLNTQLNALSNYNVNDQLSKYFYQKATNQQYALNLSGGSSKALYYFSAGYDKDLSSVRDNGNQRITITSENTFFPLKNLELYAGLNVIQTNTNSDNTLAGIQTNIFPYTQFADAKGNPLTIPYQYNQDFIQTELAKGFLDWSFAPLNELGATNNNSRLMDVRVSTGLRYTFIKGLSAEVKYQYENTNNKSNEYQSQETYATRNVINQFSILTSGKVTGYNVPLGGILSLGNSNSIAKNVRGTINYNYAWKNNSITALAGYELSQTTGDSNNSTFYGYNNDLATYTNVNPLTSFSTNPSGRSTISSGLNIGSTVVRLRSSFANVAYTYKDRYTLSGSARIDGSNYFGVATNQKSVPLWSTGIKWDINKENFYKIDWLPVLAFRSSYGYNGNLIQSITGVTTFLYHSNDPLTNLNYGSISNIGNPDLRWEKTGIANFAVDFGAKNNVVSGSLDYYFKREADLLGFKSFPENTGISSLEGNYSDMEGHGFDLAINTHNINGPFKWYTTLLVSFAANKVTHYDVTPLSSQLVGASGSTVPNVGKPVFGFYGYKWDGLDHSTGNPIGFLNGVPSQNYAMIISNTPLSDLKYIGSARPAYFGGINNNFRFKGFSLSVQISYKLGYYFMAPTINYSQIGSAGNAFLKVNRNFDKRWQNPGDEKNTNVPSLVYPFNSARDQFYQYSTVNVQNAGNIRLQDVSLSYDFRKFFHQLPFSNLQLFAYANNIAILWKANHVGLDPDAVPGPGNSTTMPIPRSISLGIKGVF